MSYASDIAFTDTVKKVQLRRGSREAYERLEQSGGWKTSITAEAKTFIESQTSAFFATANALGQPYVQHRGGPPGFLRVMDSNTIAFVDFTGNQQFITTGNLQENRKAYLFLIDTTHRKRLKFWGVATVIEDDKRLMDNLMPANYRAQAAQVILFRVSTWDANCPQHIPQRFDAVDVKRALAERDLRIEELLSQLQQLRSIAQ